MLSPGPAEAARSLLLTGSTLRLSPEDHGRVVALGGYAVDGRGRVLLPVPLGHALAGLPETPALLEVVDTAPVACRERRRGTLQLTGWLEAVDRGVAEDLWAAAHHEPLTAPVSLLRFEPIEIRLELADRSPVDVDPDEFAEAEPDPVAAHEADVLQHLAAGHAVQVEALRSRLPRGWRDADRIVPLRLHRRALVLRLERGGLATDVALALPHPAADTAADTAADVMLALQSLLTDCCGGRAAS
jgi:hypothetical protein